MKEKEESKMNSRLMYREVEEIWESDSVWGKKDAVDFRLAEFEVKVEHLSKP